MQTRSKTRAQQALAQQQQPEPQPQTHTEPRSQPQTQYEVNIDFDEAQREWRSNKRHLGNGVFEYCVSAEKTNTRRRRRSPGN
jgi:hypothetical protein